MKKSNKTNTSLKSEKAMKGTIKDVKGKENKQKAKHVTSTLEKEDPKKSTNCLNLKMMENFVDALYKLQKVREDKKSEKKGKLFQDLDEERINLMISSIKLPSDNRKQVIKIDLPHAHLQDPTEACLIVKDLEKGLKVDHEPTTVHFKDLLASKGIGPDLISTVMPLRELKVEYKQYETKTALCNKFDIFLVDDTVMKFVPTFLGRAFYRKKKFPIAVNLKAKDLKSEIQAAIKRTTLPLNHHGTSAMVQIGNMAMGKEEILANLMKVAQVLETRFPGGWLNIRALHLKTETSLSIPIYVSQVSVKDVGYVDATKPKAKPRETIEDELTTTPGYDVLVHPDFTVKLKKNGTPETDDEIDEDDPASEDEKEKKKKVNKKRPNPETEQNGKAKKVKKEDAEEIDSEDEDMEKAEQSYLKKQVETENEIIEKDVKEENKKGKKEEKKVAKDAKKTKAFEDDKKTKKVEKDDKKGKKEEAKEVDVDKKTKKVEKDDKKGKKEEAKEVDVDKKTKKVEKDIKKGKKEETKAVEDVKKTKKVEKDSKKGKKEEAKLEKDSKKGKKIEKDGKKEKVVESSDAEDEELDQMEVQCLKSKASKTVEPKLDEDEESSDDESEVFDDEQELALKDVIIDQDDSENSEEDDSESDEELVLKNQPVHGNDSDEEDDEASKPKRVKKSKKERRLDAKRKRAENPQKKSKTRSSKKKGGK